MFLELPRSLRNPKNMENYKKGLSWAAPRKALGYKIVLESDATILCLSYSLGEDMLIKQIPF